MRRVVWFVLGAVVGFVLGLFFASTSTQLADRLEEARAPIESPEERATRLAVQRKMESMGVVFETADANL